MRSRSSTATAGRDLRRGRGESALGERRWSQRLLESAVGVISYHGARCATSCRVVEISAGGARIELDLEDWVNPIRSSHALPGAFRLAVRSLGFEAECAVVWRDKARVGVRFVGKVRPLPREFRKRRSFSAR